jgi:BatD DUF11 like domain
MLSFEFSQDFMRLSRYFPSLVAQTFLSVMCLFAFTFSLFAQDVRVRATLDTTALRIGEQTTLRLTVEHSSGVQVQFPMPADTLSKNIEIVQRSGVDSSVENGRSFQKQSYLITSFEEGLHDIPTLTIQYRKPSDTALYSLQTQSLTLTVQSVRVDTTSQEDLRDIKPPMLVERTFAEMAPYLLLALVLMGAIAGGIYYWRKRKPVEEKEIRPLQPERPAYEIAMEELERLSNERLWQQGEVKEYHTRLTDILRAYAERAYGITTLETTTEDIIAQFRRAAAPAGATEMLRSVLEKGDMVKFARYEPLPDEHDRSHKLATEFVTITALKNTVLME